jgi:hypothetical protein
MATQDTTRLDSPEGAPMVGILLALGCARAWHPAASDRFDLDVPPGWTVTRNRRWFGNDFFTIRAPDGGATISVECVRRDRQSDDLPLDLLAETRALYMGRVFDVENRRWRLDQIDVDGHEAWAVTGRRTWHDASADFSMITLRLSRHVAFVTLQTPPGGLDRQASAWTRVVDSLRFPRDPVPDDAPVFAPEE